MRSLSSILAVAAVMLALTPASGAEQLTLGAGDGLPVTAELYAVPDAGPGATWIVLAHMAGASRAEYRDIAPRLNRLGYSALALDQRSGGEFAGVRNETAAAARAAGRSRDFVATTPDIEAGIAFARRQTRGPVLLWGSSYSAALAIYLAGERAGLVDGVIAMSPGEYLDGRAVGSAASRIKVPVLFVSPRGEAGQWRSMHEAVPHSRKMAFSPVTGGLHGSSALIPSLSRNAEEHWRAVEAFLATYFPR